MNQLRKKQQQHVSSLAASGEKPEKPRDVYFSNYNNGGTCGVPSGGMYGDFNVPQGYTTQQALLDGSSSQPSQTLAAIGGSGATIYSPMNPHPVSFSVCLGGAADQAISSSPSSPDSETDPLTFITLAPWGRDTSAAPQLFIGGMSTSSTGLYTVPASGTYVVDAKVTFDGRYSTVSNAGQRSVQLLLTTTNPSTAVQTQYVIASYSTVASATEAYDTDLPLHTLGEFTKGDTLALQVAQNSGDTLGIAYGPRTQWSVHPLTPASVNKINTVSVAH